MRVFGTKHIEPTDEDRVAAARLSAVAARFKAEPATDFTDVGPDPIGSPEASADDTPEESNQAGSDED
jgi:hypothetical protein